MSEGLTNLSLIGDAVFNVLAQIFNLYTTTFVFGCVLGLWVLRRIFKLFQLL